MDDGEDDDLIDDVDVVEGGSEWESRRLGWCLVSMMIVLVSLSAW